MKPTAEFRLVPMRETAPPQTRPLGDTPEAIAEYWRAQVETSPSYSHTTEQAAVIMLNTRRRITGHVIAATGTLDTILIPPREIYHAAILANAAAIVLAHNLCAAAHKLCYVERRVMCSQRLAGLTRSRVPRREECYA